MSSIRFGDVIAFATKPARAVKMISQALAANVLFSWVAADSVYLPARNYQNLLRAREQDLYRAGVMATDRLNYWPNLPVLYPDAQILFRVWHKPFRLFSRKLRGLQI